MLDAHKSKGLDREQDALEQQRRKDRRAHQWRRKCLAEERPLQRSPSPNKLWPEHRPLDSRWQ